MKNIDPDSQLRANVRLLGDILGQVLKEQAGVRLYQIIEEIRLLSKDTYESDSEATKHLNEMLKALLPEDMLVVVRAFSHFLNLANLAESVHRIRRTRWHQFNDISSVQPGSIEATLALFKQRKVNPDILYQAIVDLKIDLVFTAHPTEVMRRTLMQKFDNIAVLMRSFDEKNLTPFETQEVKENLHREITAIWQTDEIRRRPPTPIDEAFWGITVIENSIWPALPGFFRELNDQMHKLTGRELPLDASVLKFSTWMGGDRDGNPNVTSHITEKVCLLGQRRAARLYYHEVNKLSAALSMSQCNAKMRQIVGEVQEPYRAILQPLKALLYEAKKESGAKVFTDKNQILAPLLLCYESLNECKGVCIAQGQLLDLIRRVTCFGLTLTCLDIRQEAKKHTQLLDEITQHHGLKPYTSMIETDRVAFLLKQLQGDSILFQSDVTLSEGSQEVWNTFKMLKNQLPEALGAYVISMAKHPSDVLAVCLLQKEAGIDPFLRVVPLFERIGDLQSASTCLEQLFSCAWYRNHIKDHQEIMIGYSDSGKDAGIMSASWAQYTAQEQCVEVAKQYKVRLTFFHGRGGSVGRGGAPAHLAILSLPPGVINGRLRLTEQGEVIRNKYGIPERVRRTLEIYTSAVLEAGIFPPPLPQDIWRKEMDALSDTSFKVFSAIVKNNKDFIDYFNEVTPIAEIDKLAIGSRPTRREANKTIESLRAIPWVFAWTQNRSLLTAWLGAGDALQSELDKSKLAILKQMAKEWPFFGSLMSMIEMILSKASPQITQYYEQRLVQKRLYPVGELLRDKFSLTLLTLKMVLDIQAILASNSVLLRTIKLRSPYLYPLHVLQAELLYRVRKEQDLQNIPTQYKDALLISISGIAAGMQNTG